MFSGRIAQFQGKVPTLAEKDALLLWRTVLALRKVVQLLRRTALALKDCTQLLQGTIVFLQKTALVL